MECFNAADLMLAILRYIGCRARGVCALDIESSSLFILLKKSRDLCSRSIACTLTIEVLDIIRYCVSVKAGLDWTGLMDDSGLDCGLIWTDTQTIQSPTINFRGGLRFGESLDGRLEI